MAQTIAEKVREFGQGAHPLDLIAVGFSRREEDADEALPMARRILQEAGQIERIPDLDYTRLKEIAGLEPYEFVRSMALMEIGRRAAAAQRGESRTVDLPEDIFEELYPKLRHEKREQFWVVLLDAKGRVMSSQMVHVGTLTTSLVGPREVFRPAVRDGASAIAVAHNHPSGDITPSPEDCQVTEALVEAGRLLDIQVVDHIIIGAGRFFSFHRQGLLK
jgi:DNA repair protein RadC